MQKKRKAQEAFSSQVKPRLSAFAAARTKAATSNSAFIPSNGVVGPAFPTERIPDERSIAQALLRGVLADTPYEPSSSIAAQTEDDINYSSDEALGPLETGIENAALQNSVRLSTVRASGVSGEHGRLEIRLQADETVTFLGQYDLQVTRGSVVTYGALLRSGDYTHRFFVPSTHALPGITARGGIAEIVVHSVPQPLRDLAQLSPLWGRIWNDDSPIGDLRNSRATTGSFAMMQSSSDDPLQRGLVPLQIDDEAQKALNKIMVNKPTSVSPASLVMVTGPKGSGKSTFSKLLVNTLLTAPSPHIVTSCFWLDLDPGQPEFSPPGQVSLVQLRAPIFGPAFSHAITHPSTAYRTIRSHALASNSPKEDSDHFLACAIDLRDHYLRLQKEFPGAPLIVNCSGWVVGSAVSVMLALIQQFPLTDLVLMQPMDNQVVSLLQAALAPKSCLWTVPARSKPPQSRTSAEFRAMQAMSYFHSASPVDGVLDWDLRCLDDMHPWTVGYSGTGTSVAAVMSYGEPVAPECLTTVLDGMIVAVVIVEDDAALRPPPAQHARPSGFAGLQVEASESLLDRTRHTSEGLPYLAPSHTGVTPPLNPKFSHCVGLALVRKIDVERQEFKLQTPVPSVVLQGLDNRGRVVLVRGKFDSPDWAFLEPVLAGRMDDSDSLGLPYVAVRDEAAGLSGGVWRVRHMPRKLGGETAA